MYSDGKCFEKKYDNYEVATKSVITLFNSFWNKGYCVIADKYNLSPELADTLIPRGIDV